MNKEQKTTELKIIFFGTPRFGATILEGLIKNNYKPVLVITAPDKPVGRKQIITPSPVKIMAQKYNILVEQPKKIKNLKETLWGVRLRASKKIKNLKPDLGIVAAYGYIIPQEILSIPKYGFLNVHPSLLPKHRGASPIQTAILNGDKETGVTIILMDEKMDHGPIITQTKYKIPDDINHKELDSELAKQGAHLLVKTLPKWINSEIEAKAQDESKTTYTKILKKEDGKINWKKSVEEIERQIRAFCPWPGTFAFIKHKSEILRVKILEAGISKEKKLIIKKLQPEGKKVMTLEEFKKGYHDFNPLF